MFASEISHEELQLLKLVRFEGKIHLIEHPAVAGEAVKELRSYPMLGFDTETRPTFVKGKINQVALLQLSTATDAFLFRLCKMNIPKCLLSLLANPNILKIGVALKNDIDVLKRSARINPGGFIDLQNIAQEFGIKNLGLCKMAGIILGVRISKSQRLTNWENDVLTEVQQQYAATDAWMSYLIYDEIMKLKIEN